MFHFQLADVFKSIISLKSENIIACLRMKMHCDTFSWFPFCLSTILLWVCDCWYSRCTVTKCYLAFVLLKRWLAVSFLNCGTTIYILYSLAGNSLTASIFHLTTGRAVFQHCSDMHWWLLRSTSGPVQQRAARLMRGLENTSLRSSWGSCSCLVSSRKGSERPHCSLPLPERRFLGLVPSAMPAVTGLERMALNWDR